MTAMRPVQVVWFKRDLRVVDHAPLLSAARRGPLLCLYVIEPGLWQQADAAHQHYAFTLECLRDLYSTLRAHGLRLYVRHGEVCEVLSALHRETGFGDLHSHEETGNGWTYARDLAVAQWCRTHDVHWHERPQFGVVRGLRERQHWQARWDAFMAQPLADELFACSPQDAALAPSPIAVPKAHELGLGDAQPPQRQRGGRAAALAVLHDFLDQRSAQYRGGISSPLKATSACSRLSPYLAWGCVSLREVVQLTRQRLQADLPARQAQGLRAFISRLYWHCHFIQKLETEPAIEWHNMHRGYDDLREHEFNAAHFEALTQGRTGWPLVDACVAMLRETGWLNFRMRAMLVSVAAYPLWLHWRPVGEWLATQFLDYEPGIHWSQMQMQSGTTGINTTRVYNPIKQAQDQDPQGVFVRRWLPAMRRVPDVWLFEPWRMPPAVQAACGVEVGRDIPMPLVELSAATREAKQRLHARRAQPEVRAAKADIVRRHASQQTPRSRSMRQRDLNTPNAQASLWP